MAPRVPLSATGESGFLLNCEGELGVSLETMQGNQTSSLFAVESGVSLEMAETLGFLSNLWELGIPLELQWGPHDSFPSHCMGIRAHLEWKWET